jgi:hypothetical protein
VFDIRSAARNLVQGAQCQAAAWQVAIDSPNAERESRRPYGLCRPPDMGECWPSVRPNGPMSCDLVPPRPSRYVAKSREHIENLCPESSHLRPRRGYPNGLKQLE